MESAWLLLVIILICCIYLPAKRRRRYVANKLILKKKLEAKKGNMGNYMKELAERFIGKDVFIKLLDGNADGIIREVTDNGIVLDRKNGPMVVNLDYVVKLYEYPHNKKGKRSTVWEM